VRDRQQRNLLATLLLAQGVPMLCGGDEIGRTQHGNNNAYCQDNELSWLEWDLDERRKALLDFTRSLVGLRRAHPLFRLPHFPGESDPEGGSVTAEWLRPDGAAMMAADWQTAWIHAIALRLTARERNGRSIDDYLLLLNAARNPVVFALPGSAKAGWRILLDTAACTAHQESWLASGDTWLLESRSLALLQAIEHPGPASPRELELKRGADVQPTEE
jgi:isoamylase